MHIYADHLNLAYIFDPEACVPSIEKTTAQRLDQWKAVLGQYDIPLCSSPENVTARGICSRGG